MVKTCIGEVDGLLYVSDRHVCITKSARQVFPQAAHGIYMQHLSTNLKDKFKDDVMQEMFILAAKACRKLEFIYYFSQLAGFPEVQRYLEGIGFEKWTRAFQPGLSHCTFGTCLCTLTALVLRKRTYASSRETILTDYGENKMRTVENLSRTHSTIPIDHHELELSNGLKRVRVNLNAMIYGCKEFDYFQLPCSHAIAATTYRNVNRYTLCSPTYTLQTLINAYAEPVYPLRDEDDWILPDDFVDRKVESPRYVPRIGRHQTIRIPSAGETRQVHKCGRCGNMGHNRKT
ncbi:uncharacterized protein LOC111017466 [Momordica charantia]|uniref:Uncharacterized protein LOC111017466 n=1 Tax=Momordica charantia TaxID=3673 RepID=A0A6J1D499_MOMCH|nr:uncharacterized protein LOC111017466 [Momordica charantia]